MSGSKTADAATQSPSRLADEVRGKLEAQLQLECAVSAHTVKVVRLWGDYFRANYWAQVPTPKLLLGGGGTPVVISSRFLRATATPTGLEFHDLTRKRETPSRIL